MFENARYTAFLLMTSSVRPKYVFSAGRSLTLKLYNLQASLLDSKNPMMTLDDVENTHLLVDTPGHVDYTSMKREERSRSDCTIKCRRAVYKLCPDI